MKAFFETNKKKLSGSDKLFKHDLPLFILELIRNYFRLEVEGIEHVPKTGKALIVPNHSGFMGLDAVMIANEVFRATERIPHALAHPLWFIGPNIRFLAKKIGLTEVSKDAGEKLLKKNEVVLIFPEGEAGNFKPTAQRYHLQEFKRGFVRIAMATQTPIIPTVVIGAEEASINLSQIKLTKFLRGTIIPIPLNILPLPSKWKIIFLPPIEMKKYNKEDAANKKLVYKICDQVKSQIQHKINSEVRHRTGIYFPKNVT